MDSRCKKIIRRKNMVRKTNQVKYTPRRLATQLELESEIKNIMAEDLDEVKLESVNNALAQYANNIMKSSKSTSNQEKKPSLQYQALSKEDFETFSKEYNGYSATKAAEYLTAFVVKIIPSVIAGVTQGTGYLIDLAGMTTKAVGHALPIGDLGASVLGIKDTDHYNNPLKQTCKGNRLGLISGTGKLVSEIGSNLVGMGAALDTVTSLDISSPTKRLINRRLNPNKTPDRA